MRRLAVIGCWAASLAGQQVVHTAHPQESLQNGNGNLSPLGVFQSGQAAEARSQILLRNVELPGTGAVLVGMEVHCQHSVSLTYTSLTVSVSPTNATALAGTFAANLPAPQVVLAATNLTVPYSANAWTTIPLSASYVHDGHSALVIEFRKVVDPASIALTVMDTPSSPVRPDLPPMVYFFGGIGSGAASSSGAFAAGDAISIRLLWSGVPTLSHLSDATTASGNQYAIGSTVTQTIQGTPGSFYITLLDFAFQPVPLPLLGGQLRILGLLHGIGNLGGNGVATMTVAIPPVPAVVGAHLIYQGGTMDALTGLGQLTNATDHYINP